MTAKILLVDDEEIIHASVRKGLKKGNWAIDSAMSAREALAALRQTAYDLVITDLMMPGMDGLELLAEIRKSIGDVPVIMLTGYATIRTAVKAMEIGAFDYIAKPPTRRELMGVVTRALRSRGDVADAPVDLPADGETRYSLRDHSWAAIQSDGTARIGLAPAFLRTVGAFLSLELASLGDAIDQGRQCALLTTDDGAEHKIWSPLSGTVLERNGEIEGESLDLIRTDPYGRGWLIRIRPTRLDDERPQLVRVDA